MLHDRKTEIEVTLFADMLKTQEGKDEIAEYCMKDTELTWRLFERFNGFLFE
jgi:poly-gamma-glutamate capsule biosynthesis protein CapA/YwtB (metallophosphatase superfamily)